MTSFRTDPLLATARAFLTFLLGLLLLVMAGIVFGMPAVVVLRDTLLAEFAEQYGELAHADGLILSFVGILAMSLAIVACGYRFVLHLRRIVDSVAGGDPFVPENAERLRRMGWLTIAAQLLALPAAAIGRWIALTLKDADFDFGISLGGILLTITLFVLARVFRQGTEMRDDLEGTV